MRERFDAAQGEGAGPLARPGVNVSEGDVLLAINGTPLTSVAHPSELLRNQAGRQVLVRVRAASGGAERDVIVTPIMQSRDADLRYDEWEYTRRQLVDIGAKADALNNPFDDDAPTTEQRTSAAAFSPP